jgi:hypothetical protein
LYLSKLAAQKVTLTPSENLSLHLYESHNKNFNFGTLKTLILHTRSIFFKGGHPTKIWRKKIFFMKTLSKLGALTVYINESIFVTNPHPSHLLERNPWSRVDLWYKEI